MIDTLVPGFQEKEVILATIATSGYVICHDIVGINPTFSKCTYPEEWQLKYRTETYGIADPTVHWGVANNSVTRWSAIGDEFYQGEKSYTVMSLAAAYGLNFGITYTSLSDGPNPKKSFCAAARSSSEFSDREIEMLSNTFREIIDALIRASSITEQENAVLQFLVSGLSHKQIADQLEISVDQVRYRLESVRQKLQVENTTQALLFAKQAGLVSFAQNDWR